MLAFQRLYGGDDFEIAYQCAQILELVWITFLFGPGLPILFPIGTFGLIVLYYTNKVALSYFCYRPHDYNRKIAITIV